MIQPTLRVIRNRINFFIAGFVSEHGIQKDKRFLIGMTHKTKKLDHSYPTITIVNFFP